MVERRRRGIAPTCLPLTNQGGDDERDLTGMRFLVRKYLIELLGGKMSTAKYETRLSENVRCWIGSRRGCRGTAGLGFSSFSQFRAPGRSQFG